MPVHNSDKKKRFKLAFVKPYVDTLLRYLKETSGVKKAVAAGSFRRSKETVGDLNILVTADQQCPVMDEFVAYDEVKEVLSRGSTRTKVVLHTDLPVDLRLVETQNFGAALQYFTGSREHNVAVRRLARSRGLKINEHGVFKFGERNIGETEESVYQAVGLSHIPPELRENHGEIEAAAKNTLPMLLELPDIKGDLHVHTNWTDGRNTLEEMARAAKKCGLKYLAVTEHSDRLKVASGLGAYRLLEQIEKIDMLNKELRGITLLKGIEVEILKDGRLDLADDVLGRLDLVVGSIHSYFDLPRQKQTERIFRAMDHKYFSILAHPANRLINERPPIEVDMMQVINKAKKRGCYLELNANPRRLELYDIYCRVAKEQGVLVAVNSDAHNINDYKNLQFGVGQARRGWLEKDDVLNTRPLGELKKLLRQTMGL